MAANQSKDAKAATSKGGNQVAPESNRKTTSGSARKTKSVRSGTAGRGGRSQSRRKAESISPTAKLSSNLRKRLRDLEREIERTEVRYRRALAKLLGDSGNPIGIDIERRWRALTDPARHDIAKLLRRLERIVEPTSTLKRRRSAKTTRTAKAA